MPVCQFARAYRCRRFRGEAAYGKDTLVLFYVTFNSPYSYTRLGKVDEAEALAAVLGQGDARVTFARR